MLDRDFSAASSTGRTILKVFALLLACFAVVWLGGSPLENGEFILVALCTSGTAASLIALVWPLSKNSESKAKFIFGFTLVFSLMSALFVAIWVSGGEAELLEFVFLAIAVAGVCGVVGGVANVMLNE